MTPAQIQDIVQRSADDIGSSGWDSYTGWGRINAGQALDTAPISVTPAPAVTCQPPNLLGEPEDDLITLYTRLRDEVFLSSTVGKYYTNLFYTYGAELAEILLVNPLLRDRTSQFLQNASDEFGSLLPDSTDNLVLSQELYDEANALVYDIANAGDKEFKSELLQVWENMNLDEYVGQDTKVIWQEMQYVKLYLPLVAK